MGKRDYRQREQKKPKKDAKKAATPVILSQPAPEPEVVVRRKPPLEEP